MKMKQVKLTKKTGTTMNAPPKKTENLKIPTKKTRTKMDSLPQKTENVNKLTKKTGTTIHAQPQKTGNVHKLIKKTGMTMNAPPQKTENVNKPTNFEGRLHQDTSHYCSSGILQGLACTKTSLALSTPSGPSLSPSRFFLSVYTLFLRVVFDICLVSLSALSLSSLHSFSLSSLHSFSLSSLLPSLPSSMYLPTLLSSLSLPSVSLPSLSSLPSFHSSLPLLSFSVPSKPSSPSLSSFPSSSLFLLLLLLPGSHSTPTPTTTLGGEKWEVWTEERNLSLPLQQPLPLCEGGEEGRKETCLHPSPSPMSWEEAHQYCRGLNSFLPSREEYSQLEDAWWSETTTTTRAARSTLTTTTTPSPNTNTTWTSLGPYGGQYQWFSQCPGLSPAASDFVTWRIPPSLWDRDCAGYDVAEDVFELRECGDRLPFFCVRNHYEEQDLSDVELRVDTNYRESGLHGWYKLTGEELKELVLSCRAYSKTTGRLLDSQPSVVWRKDQVYTSHCIEALTPVTLHDPTKSGYSRILPGAMVVPLDDDPPVTTQGTYWCEAWHSGSGSRLRSNEVLVTLKDILVFILKAHRIEDGSVEIKEATEHLRETFKAQFYAIVNYTLDPMTVSKEVVQGSNDVLAKYTFHLHVPRDAMVAFMKTNYDQMDEYKELYRVYGYLSSSTVAFPTSCPKQVESFGSGYELEWPYSDAKELFPLNYRCRVEYGKLRPGRCAWNFTYGAQLAFDSTDCDWVDLCPQGYTLIGGQFCVATTDPALWDNGFSSAYQTGQEMSILDSPTFLRRNQSFGIYEELRDLVKGRSGLSEVWLPVRRMRKYAPLINLGPNALSFTDSNAFNEFNISWAEGQPIGEHRCLSLDMDRNVLRTSECAKKSLPFITIIRVASFNTDNSLIVNSSSCEPEWQSTQLARDLICFNHFNLQDNLTWSETNDSCASMNAQLPSPNVGFLDWVYREYLLQNDVRDVWMGAWWTPDRINYYDLEDMLSWRADTDYTKKYGEMTHRGWSLLDGNTTKQTVMCQQVKSMTEERRIQISTPHDNTSQTMCIRVTPAGWLAEEDSSKLQCYVNGVYTRHEMGRDSDCPFQLAISVQGYYECLVWSRTPSDLIRSNVVLWKDPGAFTFIISLLHEQDYEPEKHDSTFWRYDQGNSSCSDKLMTILRTDRQVKDQLRFTTFNFLYKPEDESKLKENFHLKCERKNNARNYTEEDMLYLLKDLMQYQNDDPTCRPEEIRSTVGCHEEVTRNYGINGGNLTWPKTIGESVVIPEELCVNEEGEAVTRECMGDFTEGYTWEEANNCTGKPTEITQRLWAIKNDPGGYLTMNATGSDSYDYLPALTSDGPALQPVDIHLIAKTFQSFTHYDISSMELDEIVEILNNVMRANSSSFMSAQKKLNSSGTLLEAFEELTFKVKLPKSRQDEIKKSSQEFISVERIDLQASSTIVGYKSVTKTQNKKAMNALLKKGVTSADVGDAEVAIILPNNLTFSLAFKSSEQSMEQDVKAGNERKLSLTFAVYRNDKLFQDYSDTKKYIVNSHIIQATFKRRVIKNLSYPVKIYFKPRVKKGNDTKCVFWDFTKHQGKGGWSEEGCWKGTDSSTGGDHEVCYCNHLTSFAQLINYNESNALDGIHEIVLDKITIIGCCLSILSLLLVFTTFFLFKKWRRSLSNKILVNLSFSVFCTVVLFVAGIDQIWNETLCRTVAVGLHYFILASFGWMLVEGVHQYLKFVKVVGTYIPRFLWKASVCAWGIPILPVLVLLIYDPSMYDTRVHDDLKICWMSSSGFKIAFLPPLVSTMTVNLVIYFMIIRGVMCGRTRVNSTVSERDLFMNQLTMAICVFFLLGFTWIFGLLAVSGGQVVFSYLFCIFNTLQGFFLFLFHVLRERTARKYWRDFLSILTNEPVSSTPGNSVNAQNSGHLPRDSVTYEKCGGILVFPQGVHPSQLRRNTRTSLLSARTMSSTVNSRASYNH